LPAGPATLGVQDDEPRPAAPRLLDGGGEPHRRVRRAVDADDHRSGSVAGTPHAKHRPHRPRRHLERHRRRRVGRPGRVVAADHEHRGARGRAQQHLDRVTVDHLGRDDEVPISLGGPLGGVRHDPLGVLTLRAVVARRQLQRPHERVYNV